MKIIAVTNQKGGCGKTTISINLAYALSLRGKRVLLVDLDPQAYATIGFGYEPESLQNTIYSAIIPELPQGIHDVTIKLSENLWLAPSNIDGAMKVFGGARDQGDIDQKLYLTLKSVENDFDFVVLDCPTALDMLLMNALVAADYVILPVDESIFSVKGLDKALQLIDSARATKNRPIKPLIIFSNMSPRQAISKKIRHSVKNKYPDLVLKTLIHASEKIKESTYKAQTIIKDALYSETAIDFISLAKEIISITGQDADTTASTENFALGVQRLDDGLMLIYQNPEAVDFKVAGSFNNWNPADGNMVKINDDGLWAKFVPLAHGQHQYRILVDGQWQTDELNPDRTQNEFGEFNSLLNY